MFVCMQQNPIHKSLNITQITIQFKTQSNVSIYSFKLKYNTLVSFPLFNTGYTMKAVQEIITFYLEMNSGLQYWNNKVNGIQFGSPYTTMMTNISKLKASK